LGNKINTTDKSEFAEAIAVAKQTDVVVILENMVCSLAKGEAGRILVYQEFSKNYWKPFIKLIQI
jgi:hypothetical protein